MKAKTRGLDAADNGNEFLCRNCVYGRQRSGTNKQLEMHCSNDDFRNRHGGYIVPFAVTSCDGFKHKDIKTFYEVPSDTKKIARFLDRRETIQGERNPDFMKYVDASRAVDTKLITEYYLGDD